MSFLQRVTRHPALLPRTAPRDRREWRRTVRQVTADHDRQTALRLRSLRGAAILGTSTTAHGTVELALRGWTVALAGVSASGRHAVTMAGERTSWLGDSGSYGPFWWLEVCSAAAGTHAALRGVALGAPIRLVPDRWTPDSELVPTDPQLAGSPLGGPIGEHTELRRYAPMGCAPMG